jgi:chromosomal replication initiator protein
MRARLLEQRAVHERAIAAIDRQLEALPGGAATATTAPRQTRIVASDVGRPGAPINAKDIIDAAARYYGVWAKDVVGRSRNLSIARVRNMAMYLVRTFTKMSYPEIGREFDGRDHTTVMSAVEGVGKRDDAEQVAELDELERVIGAAVRARAPSAVAEPA